MLRSASLTVSSPYPAPVLLKSSVATILKVSKLPRSSEYCEFCIMPKKNSGSRCVMGLEGEEKAKTVLSPAFALGLSLFLSAMSSSLTTSSASTSGDGVGGTQFSSKSLYLLAPAGATGCPAAMPASAGVLAAPSGPGVGVEATGADIAALAAAAATGSEEDSFQWRAW
jgi:hypothetical protein